MYLEESILSRPNAACYISTGLIANARVQSHPTTVNETGQPALDKCITENPDKK
jgi:hypothetical protein